MVIDPLPPPNRNKTVKRVFKQPPVQKPKIPVRKKQPIV